MLLLLFVFLLASLFLVVLLDYKCYVKNSTSSINNKSSKRKNNILVSLRWCKDNDVNELVNKLRFHNASNITVTKMESRHAKWKVEIQKCSKYHLQHPANIMQYERVYLPNVADVMQNERFYLHNALCCLFRCFFGLDGFASFLSSWLC